MTRPRGQWPYPGDSPLARARRIAQAYRARLDDVAPDYVADLDQRFVDWGETWIVPRLAIFDLDDWLTPGQAAELGGVDTATVRMWRARGRLRGHRDAAGHWIYLARDVIALISAPRTRRVDHGTAGQDAP